MRPEDLAVEHKTATTNGIRLHYVEAGGRERPLVVLLHGFPEFWFSWRYQIQPLVDAGFRVIAPDQRGYNDSEKHGPYDANTLAADIAGLIEHAGARRAHIVGHDWGGAIAWQFAINHPEMCERLVVLNCPHPAMFKRGLEQSSVQRKKSWYMFMFQLPLLPELWITRKDGKEIESAFYAGAVDKSRLNKEELRYYRDAMLKPGAARAAIGWYRTALRSAFIPGGKKPTFRTIEAPTTLIWGRPDFALDYDALVPGTERFAPKLEVRTLDGVGHFCQTEAPERVNPLLLDALRADQSVPAAIN